MEKVVLVTGGSKGIGKAICRRLQQQGYTVIGTSRSPEKLGPDDVNYPILKMDVNDDFSTSQAFERLLAQYGRLDVLVSNAGYGLAGSIEDTSVEEAKAQFETNFFGAHRVVRAALSQMRRQRQGVIIIIGSAAGRTGIPFQGMYSASKFALEGYTEALRLEAAPFNIKVCIIEPGDTRSEFSRMWVKAAEGSAYAARAACAVETMEHAEKNGAQPEPIARLVERIINSSHPAIRYPIGLDAVGLSIALRLLPARFLQKFIKVYYKA